MSDGVMDLPPNIEITPHLARELVTALSQVLAAWDYNGGGDAWCREVWGPQIQAARGVLEIYEGKEII